MQCLFEGSEESIDDKGLGIIPGLVRRFDSNMNIRVPHMGWNGFSRVKECTVLENTTISDKVRRFSRILFIPSLL